MQVALVNSIKDSKLTRRLTVWILCSAQCNLQVLQWQTRQDSGTGDTGLTWIWGLENSSATIANDCPPASTEVRTVADVSSHSQSPPI